MNCFNGEKYLRPALDSVLAQTYQNWELIFWDNQSTDRSPTICNSYRDSRIRYFRASEHTELGVARILAFRETRGELIAILDADDVARPERLTRQVAFLEQHPDVALVGSWAEYIDERDVVLGEYKPPASQGELQDCLGWTNPIVHSSTMYRHQLAMEVGGYPADLLNSSDYGLVLALAQRFRIAVVDDFLCQLRILATSISRSKQYRKHLARESLMLFQHAAAILPLSTKARRLNRRAQAVETIKLGMYRLSEGFVWSGLMVILGTVLSVPSVLWGNGPVRRFLGKPF